MNFRELLPIYISFSSWICLAVALTKPDFRYISRKDLQQSIKSFSLEGMDQYSQIMFDVARDQIIIGARDTLYKMHLSKVELLEAVKWEATREKQLSCIYKGQDEGTCHNFIKILLTNGHEIFACGTNAFSPICSWRNIEDLSNVTQLLDGVAKCPYNPAASVTGILSQSSEYFFGGTTDFSSSDSLISKNINGVPLLRTKQYNSFWLNDPEFVGSFETTQFVYFLFRETAVEYLNCGKIVYSRIARVCKNDQGGHTMLRDNWTTFIKARLNCSVSGDYPFYYNEIQSAQYIPGENVVYAAFTTPANSIAGSAVCAFNMTAIDEAFNGPFKHQHDMDSAWTSHDVPHREHLECKPFRHSSLLETSRFQLMDNAVQATTLDPLHIANLERFTHIAIDVVHPHIHVIYVATEEGSIKKLTAIPHMKMACVVEIWQVTSNHRHSINNMQFLKKTNSIYATIEDSLISIQADHCRRHSSKESCLNAMDPYCGWNELVDGCTSVPEGDSHHKYWKQLSLSCPVLDTPINGGWSSWSEWKPCYHRISSESDNDQCVCQTRHCNNPAPANDGQPCGGSSVAVVNCTVHGGWSDWSAWSACSATCGTAVKTRFRTCTNPAPAFGGRVCVGQDRTEAFCTENPPCPTQPTHGGWSGWSHWSACSTNCTGYKTRDRKCDNPTPKNGGEYCKGNDLEYAPCNEAACKDHKQLHVTEWITDANISIRHYHQKRFKITCKAPVKHPQQIKVIVKDESQVCYHNKCEPEEGDHNGWSSWSSWSECSAICDGGTQTRTRQCYKGNCLGSTTQTKECNKHSCENNWSCWTEWSPCNASCGWGVKTRYRECLDQKCKGADSEKEACHDQPCENILGWGNWTEWSICDENDLQYRRRTCYTDNPGPHMCQGNVVQERMCVGSALTNEINDYGFPISDCSCIKSNFSWFFLGIICGLVPPIIYLILNTIKKKDRRVPSTPNYMPASLNSYVSVPVKDKKHALKKQHSYTGNGTLKNEISTLKRHSNEMKNLHAKPYYMSTSNNDLYN
uniref:Sema domain-containing protein n=1 Tax=Dendroctonus ponderosae TaxID=77166 RepID=A0AAR5PWR0_DENPD